MSPTDPSLKGLDDRSLLLVIAERVGQMQHDVADLKKRADDADDRFVRRSEWEEEKARAAKEHGELVSRAEFDPVRLIVYGMVGFVLLAVLTAIVALVITNGSTGHKAADALDTSPQATLARRFP